MPIHGSVDAIGTPHSRPVDVSEGKNGLLYFQALAARFPSKQRSAITTALVQRTLLVITVVRVPLETQTALEIARINSNIWPHWRGDYRMNVNSTLKN